MNIDTERLCKELRDIQEAHLHYFPGVQWTPLQHKALDTAIALIGTLSETVASVEALVKDFGGADSGNAASGSANPTGAEEAERAPTVRPKPPAAPPHYQSCGSCKHDGTDIEEHPCMYCWTDSSHPRWEPKPDNLVREHDKWIRQVGRVSETEQHAVRAGWMEG